MSSNITVKMPTKEDEWNAMWRASAHESVPYTDYLPECLLTLPELIDGSLAQGNASNISINFNLKTDSNGKATFTLTDTGKGITNLPRLLSWSSKNSTETHHRYGHGSKKCLTKFMRDYESAEWEISYRLCDRRGNSGSLFTLKAPFVGLGTETIENSEDDKELMPSGTRWTIKFNPSILGKFNNTEELFQTLKELLCVRYSRKHFTQAEFILSVTGNVTTGKKLKKVLVKTFMESSRKDNWRTFQECLENEVVNRNAYVLYDVKKTVNGGFMEYKEYKVTIDGKQVYDLKRNFPIYGQRNMKCSLCHIALDGRVIESMPIFKIYSREANHNDFNGRYGFVDFIPDENDPLAFEKFPTPCTTKVSFYPNCDKFQVLLNDLKHIYEKQKPNPEPKYPIIKPEAKPESKPIRKPNPLKITNTDDNLDQILSTIANSNETSSTVNKSESDSESSSVISEKDEVPIERNIIVPQPTIVLSAPPPPANPIPIPKPNNPFTFTKSQGNLANFTTMIILEDGIEIAKILTPSSVYASYVIVLEKYYLEFGRERFREYVVDLQKLHDRYKL
jgi:hypothetical protein